MASTSAAARGFAAAYARAPEGVWSAPGRVNLIGEHTDYNAGLVLPFAISERTVVAAGRRPDDVITVSSTLYSGTVRARLARIAPGTVTGWGAYPLGVAWAQRPHGHKPVDSVRRGLPGRRHRLLVAG